MLLRVIIHSTGLMKLRKIIYFMSLAILSATLLIATAISATEPTNHLRYLAINVGNASPEFGCWEYKLCRSQDVKKVRDYIATWQPDIIMLSEVYRAEQLTGKAVNGPILPPGYTGTCGASRDRYTNKLVSWYAENASHEHECIAWKTARLSLVPNITKSAYGRNDVYSGKATPLESRRHGYEPPKCNYDFTGFRVELLLQNQTEIAAVTVHPNSSNAKCRQEETSRYWSTLAEGERVVIGGDWNTSSDAELQKPSTFKTNYSRGQHWDIVNHSREYSAQYFLGLAKRQFDHTYSNFGIPCTTCGKFYNTPNLPFGSALGGYDGHPRADNGSGMDHRQILVDILIP
jgi:hypothetical protein